MIAWISSGSSTAPENPCACRIRRPLDPYSASIFNAAMKASRGMSTLPNWRIFFLPSFCLSGHLLAVASRSVATSRSVWHSR